MNKTANIKEIFSSIQGEGTFIGYKQLFVRFCGCNLNCKYCDTDFELNNSKEYTVEELAVLINSYDNCHSVSLTGGEPLLHYEFLEELLPKLNIPIYLETNATLYNNLTKIIDKINYIAADIKLPSCSGNKELWDIHDRFFNVGIKKFLFIKIVFDKNITIDEINLCCSLAKKYDIEIVLQPKMDGNNLLIENEFIEKILEDFLKKHKKTRIIPQVHKFLDVR